MLDFTAALFHQFCRCSIDTSHSILNVTLSFRCIVFQHFHTVNISFENNILLSLGKRPVINGTNWLMCFVFTVSPGYFIILLLGSGAASCISEKYEGIQQQSFLTFYPSACLLFNQQHGRLDLAARHHLQEFQERRLPLDNDAQSAPPDLEQWESALHAEVKDLKTQYDSRNKSVCVEIQQRRKHSESIAGSFNSG